VHHQPDQSPPQPVVARDECEKRILGPELLSSQQQCQYPRKLGQHTFIVERQLCNPDTAMPATHPCFMKRSSPMCDAVDGVAVRGTVVRAGV
jgi:hypothetical protein